MAKYKEKKVSKKEVEEKKVVEETKKTTSKDKELTKDEIRIKLYKFMNDSSENESDTKYNDQKRRLLYNLYHSIRLKTETTPAWRSKLFLGLTFGNVQSKLAIALPGFSNTQDFYSIKPFRKEIEIDGKKVDAEASAKAMQLLMKAQEQDMRLFQNLHTITLSSLIFSRCWGKITWDKEKKEKKYFNYEEGTIKKVDEVYEVNSPRLTAIADFDMIIPKQVYSDNLDDLEYLGNYYWVDPKTLKDSKYYNNNEEVEEFLASLGDDEKEWPDKVRLAEIYCNNYIYVITDDPTRSILKSHYQPYKHNKFPYAVMIENPDGFGLDGISTVEAYADIQEWLNTLVNGTIDEMRLSMHKMFIIKSSSDITTDQIKTKPGLVIKTRDGVKDIEVIDPPAAKQDVYPQIQQMQSFSDQIIGQFDQIDSKAKGTATEARLSFQRANARINLFIEYNRQGFLKRLLTLWIEMNQQFVTVDDLEQFIPEEELEKVYEEADNVDLKARFIFKVTGDKGQDDKATMMDKIGVMVESLGGMENLPEWVDKKAIGKMLIRTLDYDPDVFILADEDIPAPVPEQTPQGQMPAPVQGQPVPQEQVVQPVPQEQVVQPGNIEDIKRELTTAAQSLKITVEELIVQLSKKSGLPPEQVIQSIVQLGGLNAFLQKLKGGE